MTNCMTNSSVERRPSQVLSTKSPICRAKLTTRCDDRRAVAKFYTSRVFDSVPDSNAVVYFEHSRIFLQYSVKMRPCQQQAGSVRFDKTLTCDGRTHDDSIYLA